MVNEYTPDEFNVLMAWVTTGIGPEDNLKSEFDRWLDQVRAAARREGQAEAFNEGLAIGICAQCYVPNPYETEEDRHVDR